MKINKLIIMCASVLLLAGCGNKDNPTPDPTPCTDHIDENPIDHKCDKCGEVLTTCIDQNIDGKCDVCGANVPIPPCEVHKDKNLDGICDVCGTAVPVPEPEPEKEISKKYEDLGSYSEYKSICTGGSYSLWFDEVDAGRFLAENNTYAFNFSSSYAGDPSFEVTSLYEEHAKVRRDPEIATKFYLDTYTAGDTVLIITNAIGDLVYQNVVRIRPSYTVKEIYKIMYDSDYFRTLKAYESYIGKWVFTMVDSSNSHRSVISGNDDYDSATCSFNLEYDSFSEYNDLYYFVCTDAINSSPYTNVSTIAISRTGDAMYAYYLSGEEEHLLSILYNVDVKYVYEN